MTQDDPIDQRARERLKSLRTARGWSLDELADRSFISASTISRIETGRRRIALDQLVTLAKALDTSVDAILADPDAEDVIIRPTEDRINDILYWYLTRPNDASGRLIAKVRYPATMERPTTAVHPGRDWFYVLSGTAHLVLGDKDYLVHKGHAADFDTMTPHRIVGHREPVEILMIFDHHGEQAHLRPT